jgi:hypothetical protein
MPPDDTNQEQPSGDEPQRPRDGGEQGPIAGVAALIDAYRHEQETNREQEASEDFGRKWREWATLAFIILTTIGIFYQACILNSTDESIRNQTIINARPWVGLTDEGPSLQTSPLRFDKDGNATIGYAISSKNFSNAAAQNVQSYAQLIVTEDMASIDKIADVACSENFIGKMGMGFVLFPGKFQNIEYSSSQFDKTAMSNPGADGKYEAWLVGCVGYRDQFNVLYRTKFYYWYVDKTTERPITFIPGYNSEISGHFIEHRSSVE